jgi:hypothetical protein
MDSFIQRKTCMSEDRRQSSVANALEVAEPSSVDSLHIMDTFGKQAIHLIWHRCAPSSWGRSQAVRQLDVPKKRTPNNM